jgi:prefoldin subunit 5
MKIGLLTVLLASLVLVGCLNYDDQFDDLNAQISALKSQVDGLSALSGQVSSLSGTISGLQAGISAAQASASSAATAASAIELSGLSASLATLQAEVDAIEAAIATTATATEVAALQTSLTAVETDLADLLVSNNVYSTAIAVTDAASMASALALGNKVALMNSSVTITDNAAISDTDIQTFVDKIATMNGTFSYSSGSATGFTPTFDKMVAGKDMIITAAGDISFKALASATTIEIHDDYETKITSVDFGAMTSVTSFTTDEGGVDDTNALELDSATNIDLGSLARYGSALDIRMKKRWYFRHFIFR